MEGEPEDQRGMCLDYRDVKYLTDMSSGEPGPLRDPSRRPNSLNPVRWSES